MGQTNEIKGVERERERERRLICIERRIKAKETKTNGRKLEPTYTCSYLRF